MRPCGTRDDDRSDEPREPRLTVNALLARWLALSGMDVVRWHAEAIELQDDVWLPGRPPMGPLDASFRRRWRMIDASFKHDIIGYSLVGRSVTLAVPATWPMTVTGALIGRALADVVSTPITRGIDATVLAVRRLGGRQEAMIFVIADADVIELSV